MVFVFVSNSDSIKRRRNFFCSISGNLACEILTNLSCSEIESTKKKFQEWRFNKLSKINHIACIINKFSQIFAPIAISHDAGESLTDKFVHNNDLLVFYIVKAW